MSAKKKPSSYTADPGRRWEKTQPTARRSSQWITNEQDQLGSADLSLQQQSCKPLKASIYDYASPGTAFATELMDLTELLHSRPWSGTPNSGLLRLDCKVFVYATAGPISSESDGQVIWLLKWFSELQVTISVPKHTDQHFCVIEYQINLLYFIYSSLQFGPTGKKNGVRNRSTFWLVSHLTLCSFRFFWSIFWRTVIA